MKIAVRDFEVKLGIKLIWCRYLALRINSALLADMWASSTLCKDVENAMIGAYTMFNRSTQSRKELQALVVEFGKVKFPWHSSKFAGSPNSSVSVHRNVHLSKYIQHPQAVHYLQSIR